MGPFLNAEPAQRIIIQAPADVIVAAQVVQEYILLGQGKHLVQLLPQQRGIPGGNRMPGGSHGGHVVEHMALRLFRGAEIGHHLLRLHHHFAQKQNAGTDDLPDHPHHSHDGVHLLQIPALGPQFLPNVRNCINADNINAPVGQVQEIGHHFIEHPGIAVVQVPLVGVEGGHHIVTALRQPGEISRGRGGEHLGNSLFIDTRNVPGIEEEVPAHVFPFPIPGPDRPLVILAGVVHHEIHAHLDALFMAGLGQFFQVLHGTQLFLDLAEVLHRVAAVTAAGNRVQEGHQVDVVDVAAFDVG